ncbi:MAG: hypothetical protein V3W18_02650 [candidate division Zixibacteria bacterium]
MLIWSFVLLGLGILAVLDSQFNYGHIFRSTNAVVYLLLSLGVLIRTKILGNQGYRERLVRKNIELEAKVEELQRSLALLEKRDVKQNILA